MEPVQTQHSSSSCDPAGIAPSVDVSVIIPCFNCGSTIRRALLSVASQTLHPAEVIVVDDGSEPEIEIDRILSEFTQFRSQLIRLSVNSGPATARNAGWDQAKGKYIAFLDADDTWFTEKLRIQYGYMRMHDDVLMSGHPYQIKPESGKPITDAECFDVTRVSASVMLLSNRFSTPTVMLKRDIPYRFTTGKRYAEDYLLWLQIILDGNRAVYLSVPLARLHKSTYGEAGLSGRLWEMEKGELLAYYQLAVERRLGWVAALMSWIFSLLKYMRRLLLVAVRKMSKQG